MSDCRDYQDRLAAYAASDLSGAERDAVMRHVDGCPACALEVDGYRRVIETLPRLTASPPDVERARRRLEEAMTRDEDSSRVTLRQRWAMVAIAAGLLLGLRLLWGVAANPESFKLLESINTSVVTEKFEGLSLDRVTPRLPERFFDEKNS